MCYGQTPEEIRRMGVWSKSRLKRRAWALTTFGFLEDFALKYFDMKLASIIFPTWFFWPPCHFEVMHEY